MLKRIRNHAAGIDIGARAVYVAVEGQPVVSYGTFTSDFSALCAYLKEHHISTVAMEATGVYWVVLYDMLVQQGLDVWLIDGRQTRQVPGRKTDVKDCQWIQQLHSYGLFNRCMVAEGLIRELRSYQRLRQDHIRSAAMHVNHMHKALTEMNIRLPEVLSQVQGSSGMKIIEAMLAEERDPQKLLALCHKRIREEKSEQVLKALEGHYTPAGLFALRQAYQAYHFYQQQITACDKELEAVLQRLNQDKQEPEEKQPRKPVRHHKPAVAGLGKHLLMAFDGKDATVLSGITDYSWLQLLSETGQDLTKWASEKHFTSWLGLSPGQNNSGKKKRSARKARPRAGEIFRQIAQSLLNSKNIALGAFARRLRARKGAPVAVKATARKLAEQYWRLMVKGSEFVERGIEHYQQQLILQKQKYLYRLANELKVEISA
jgi:transposase